MSIWFKQDIKIDDIIPISKDTMGEYIGIEWLEVGEDFMKAKMPVDHRTQQPYGLLHGGASCTLAETIGSVASAMVIDHTKCICVGLEINANHIKSARQGFVTGIAKPLHLGATTHVWDIRIYDEKEQLVCVSRLTVAILAKRPEYKVQSHL
jgi:1,4-dihydroxy-2-naphthoyl-CoA hydrolase